MFRETCQLVRRASRGGVRLPHQLCAVVVVTAAAGCLAIPEATYDNPCDPRNGGCVTDALVFRALDGGAAEDAATADAALPDATPPPRDAARPDAAAPPPDARPPDQGPAVLPCPSAGFSNVADCPSRLTGACAYEFDVYPGFSHCGHFCAQIDQSCVRAWLPDAHTYCTPVREVPCDTQGHQMVCGCR